MAFSVAVPTNDRANEAKIAAAYQNDPAPRPRAGAWARISRAYRNTSDL